MELFDDFMDMDDLASQDLMSSSLPSIDSDELSLDINPMEMGSTSKRIPVVDMFGNTHLADPMDVDIMSGLPSSEFHSSLIDGQSNPSFTGDSCQSYDQMQLDKGNEIEAMRDTAVEHYQDAKARGDIDEMLKWETEANKQQGKLYDHWKTPTYGLPPKAPGIN